MVAISLATINPARYSLKFFKFHNHPDIGEIALGKSVNMVVLSSLDDIKVEKVIYRGKPVVDCKRYRGMDVDYDYSGFSGNSNNLFMEIAFLLLPVIPELRITNRRLADVNAFEFVTLFI